MMQYIHTISPNAFSKSTFFLNKILSFQLPKPYIYSKCFSSLQHLFETKEKFPKTNPGISIPMSKYITKSNENTSLNNHNYIAKTISKTFLFKIKAIINKMGKSPGLVFIIITIQVTMSFLPVLIGRLDTYRAGLSLTLRTHRPT